MHEKDKNKLQQEKKIDKAKSTNERKKKEKMCTMYYYQIKRISVDNIL